MEGGPHIGGGHIAGPQPDGGRYLGGGGGARIPCMTAAGIPINVPQQVVHMLRHAPHKLPGPVRPDPHDGGPHEGGGQGGGAHDGGGGQGIE